MVLCAFAVAIVTARVDSGTPFEEPECKKILSFRIDAGTPFEEPEFTDGGDPDEVFIF